MEEMHCAGRREWNQQSRIAFLTDRLVLFLSLSLDGRASWQIPTNDGDRTRVFQFRLGNGKPVGFSFHETTTPVIGTTVADRRHKQTIGALSDGRPAIIIVFFFGQTQQHIARNRFKAVVTVRNLNEEAKSYHGHFTVGTCCYIRVVIADGCYFGAGPGVSAV